VFDLVYSQSQEPKIDSLKLLVKTLEDDSTKVNALNELSRLSRIYFIDDPILYAQNAKTLADRINYFFGIAQAMENLGGSYLADKDLIKREDYYNQALLLYKEVGNEKGVDRMVKELALLYESADTKKAIDFYLKSLNRAKEIGDNEGISYALFKIGNLYYRDLTLYTESIFYFLQALKHSQEITDHETFLNASLNIGDIYFTLENYDSALIYFKKCYTVAEESSNENFISYLNTRFGEVYKNVGDFLQAVNYHKKAFEYHKVNDNQWSLWRSLIYLGSVYIAMKDYQTALDNLIEAESFLNKAYLIKDGVIIKSSQRIKIKPEEEVFTELGQKEIYSGFVIVYERISDFKNAYKYQTYLSNIKTSNINQSEVYHAENTRYLLKQKNTSDSIRYSSKISNLEEGIKNEIRIKKIYFGTIICAIIALIIVIYFIFKIRFQKDIIHKEKIKSDNLLLNILPSEVAEELKITGKSDARNFANVSVLFTDFKEFTKIAETLDAKELVEEIDTCFKSFDKIITNHQIEKIKTIGDAYMAAGGLHTPSMIAAKNVILAGLDMLSFMKSRKVELQRKNKPYFEMRVGIHTGPVVAGIVGVKKFQYDIWGDTVNIANRMERSGEIGKLNISESTYNLIKDDPYFGFEYMGKIYAKNKGELEMYFADVLSHNKMPS
jgi:class 3 adenylate cyclase